MTALKNSGKFVPWQVVTISTDGESWTEETHSDTGSIPAGGVEEGHSSAVTK